MQGKMEDYFHRLKPNWVELESENNFFQKLNKSFTNYLDDVHYAYRTKWNIFSFNLTLEWF